MTLTTIHCDSCPNPVFPPKEGAAADTGLTRRVDAVIRPYIREIQGRQEVILHRTCYLRKISYEESLETEDLRNSHPTMFSFLFWRPRFLNEPPPMSEFLPFPIPINEEYFTPTNPESTQKLVKFLDSLKMRNVKEHYYSLQWGNPEKKTILRLVKERADPLLREYDVNTPLFSALKSRDCFFARALLTRAFDPNETDVIHHDPMQSNNSYASEIFYEIIEGKTPLFPKEELDLYLHFLENDEQQFFEAIASGADSTWALIMALVHEKKDLAGKIQRECSPDMEKALDLAIKVDSDTLFPLVFPQTTLEQRKNVLYKTARRCDARGLCFFKRHLTEGMVIAPHFYAEINPRFCKVNGLHIHDLNPAEITSIIRQIDRKTVRGLLSLSFLAYQKRLLCSYYWIHRRSFSQTKAYTVCSFFVRHGTRLCAALLHCVSSLFSLTPHANRDE